MIRILIVEDERPIANLIDWNLTSYGYSCQKAYDGLTAADLITEHTYDLVLLDIMLPGIDGYSLLEQIKPTGTPVIFLTAKGSVADRVQGLRAGADDYLVKPFSFSELIARIQALLRRASATAEPSTLTVGDLSIDLLSRKVYRGSTRIDIQPLEFTLLEYLARNAGRVVSKTMIMEHVWEYNFDPQTNIVETRMCRLREKLDKPFKEKLLHTVRGFGYVLEPEADFRHR